MTARCRVIIDNDFSGDPDDLFQLAHHALSPSVEIPFVIGSHLAPGDPFDPSDRQAQNAAAVARELLGLIGADIPVIAGSETGLDDPATPKPGPAVDAIIREAMRDDTDLPLYLALGAGLTELAGALLIEPRIAERRQFARGISDRQARLHGMGARGGDILGRGVDAGDRRAEPGERFAQQARAAADVERGLAGEGGEAARIASPMRVDLLADIAEPRRIELVKHRRGAVRVPPVGGERAEMRGFGGVDGGGADRHAVSFRRKPRRCEGLWPSFPRA